MRIGISFLILLAVSTGAFAERLPLCPVYPPRPCEDRTGNVYDEFRQSMKSFSRGVANAEEVRQSMTALPDDTVDPRQIWPAG